MLRMVGYLCCFKVGEKVYCKRAYICWYEDWMDVNFCYCHFVVKNCKNVHVDIVIVIGCWYLFAVI